MGNAVPLAQVVLFVLFISSIVFFVRFAQVKYAIGKTVKYYEQHNVLPGGAELTHGMVRRGNGDRGVISDSKPSLLWYQRLLR